MAERAINLVKRILRILQQVAAELLNRTYWPQDEVDFKPQGSTKDLTGFSRKKLWSRILFLWNLIGQSKAIKFYSIIFGNDINCHKDILKSLHISPQDLVLSVDQSDVIIAFVTIVSRAGTDITSALQNISETRPVVLVVLHHTFDENYIPPKSSQEVCGSNVLAVDFLFYEDQGILNCLQNATALEATTKYLQDIKCNRKVFG